MKEANLKWLDVVQFQLYNILSKDKLEMIKKKSVVAGGWEWGEARIGRLQNISSKNTQYVIIMIDKYHFKFARPVQ